MQTFLPSPDFKESAKILDYKRLGKQRPEANQLYRIVITEPHSSRWKNQPLVMMWRDYPDALALYLNTMIEEWIERGYNNTMRKIDIVGEVKMPHWIGLDEYHSSHRATLLAKYPDYYSYFLWKETPKLGYYWPVRNVKS